MTWGDATVWRGRLLWLGFNLVATALVVVGVAFGVADYVVRANTASQAETNRAMQHSIDTNAAASRETNADLRATIAANAAASEQATERLSQAAGRSADRMEAASAAAEARLSRVLDGLDQTVRTLNQTVTDLNGAVGGLRSDTTFLTSGLRRQEERIDRISREIEQIKLSIAAIPYSTMKYEFVSGVLGELLTPDAETWSTISARFGLEENQPLFLEIRPPASRD